MYEDNKKHMMYAVMHSTLKDVKDALEKYKLKQDASFFDYELLKAACDRKNLSIVDFLLDLGCRVRNPKETDSEEMLLNQAMKLNNANIIRNILRNGASIYDKYLNGESLLWTALKAKYYNSVDEVLENSNYSKVNSANKNDILNFHIACVRNHYHIVENFLKQGFDVNYPLSLDSEKYYGLNPLHYAAKRKFLDVYELLLRYGGDLSVPNSEAQTPLHIIFHSFFLKSGADVIFKTFDHNNVTKYINCIDNYGVSHFHISCVTNSPIHVKKFIEKGVNINSAIFYSSQVYPGFTALHIAVVNACEELVELLLKNGADCNKADKEGKTPLHLACQLSVSNDVDESIIKMLLENKACPTAVDKKGRTPLHTAFYHLKCEKSQIFDLLMSKISGEVDFIDDQGLSHFHIACARNCTSLVSDFLTSRVNINNPVSSGVYSGYTALHFAALYCRRDIVKMLLEKNAQVNVKTSESLSAPLHFACEFNREKFYEHYLKYDDFWSNVKYGSVVNEDWTSNRRNQLDIIKLLLAGGAEVDAKDSLGKTSLLHACMVSDNYRGRDWCYTFKCVLIKEISDRLKGVVDILLSNGANVTVQMNDRSSILHIISKNKFLENLEELTEFLITKGANVHAADHNGLTALHVAVKYGHLELVQLFLKHKANANAMSNDHQIPLQLLDGDFASQFHSNNDILIELLENGSNVNVIREDGSTILQGALKNLNIFILEKLLYYGADLHMKDASEIPCIDSLFERNKLVYEYPQRQKESFQVQKIILNHLQKLIAVGIDARQNTRMFDDLSHAFNVNCTKSENNKFIEELNRMKLIKIDKYTSLYSILLKNSHDLLKHVRNNTLIKIVNDEGIDNNFPFYSYLLKLQFRKGLMRRDVLQYSKESLNYIVGFNLPDLCYDSLVQHLTNEDITNLKVAVLLTKGSLKRRINNNSVEMEPLAKLQIKE